MDENASELPKTPQEIRDSFRKSRRGALSKRVNRGKDSKKDDPDYDPFNLKGGGRFSSGKTLTVLCPNVADIVSPNAILILPLVVG